LAQENGEKLLPLIESMIQTGYSYMNVARELNRAGYRTCYGTRWGSLSVKNLIMKNPVSDSILRREHSETYSNRLEHIKNEVKKWIR
jgi:hypothetical protein